MPMDTNSRQCPNCGTPLEAGAKRCPNCGKSLKGFGWSLTLIGLLVGLPTAFTSACSINLIHADRPYSDRSGEASYGAGLAAGFSMILAMPIAVLFFVAVLGWALGVRKVPESRTLLKVALWWLGAPSLIVALCWLWVSWGIPLVYLAIAPAVALFLVPVLLWALVRRAGSKPPPS